MKNLKDILERKDDTICTLPRWADFICIDLNTDDIEFYTIKELHENDGANFGVVEQHIEKLKVGESYFDKKDQAIYVMLIDQEALNEK